jgi:hypothetical protein
MTDGAETPRADTELITHPQGSHAVLATRNTKDFWETGIDVVDPWQQD